MNVYSWIQFAEKPSPETIAKLKSRHYTWNSISRVWDKLLTERDSAAHEGANSAECMITAPKPLAPKNRRSDPEVVRGQDAALRAQWVAYLQSVVDWLGNGGAGYSFSRGTTGRRWWFRECVPGSRADNLIQSYGLLSEIRPPDRR